jgi:hypothetical protein
MELGKNLRLQNWFFPFQNVECAILFGRRTLALFLMRSLIWFGFD